jgi:pilus assembly protein Flp/PilA
MRMISGLRPRIARSRMGSRSRGVTSIEYALLGALIAVAIAASVSLLGERVVELYTQISQKLAEAMGGP